MAGRREGWRTTCFVLAVVSFGMAGIAAFMALLVWLSEWHDAARQPVPFVVACSLMGTGLLVVRLKLFGPSWSSLA